MERRRVERLLRQRTRRCAPRSARDNEPSKARGRSTSVCRLGEAASGPRRVEGQRFESEEALGFLAILSKGCIRSRSPKSNHSATQSHVGKGRERRKPLTL